MQQKLYILLLALVATLAAAQPATLLPAAPGLSTAAAGFNGLAAPGAAPLAISSSQRLDYFNQLNAAFAPAARLIATPSGLAAFPSIFGFPRFGQLAAANAPFIF
ncbi:uncharacterized protein LOC6582516 [Drosophila mojavensis]|uniref:Uncharacterized protein n=1 Tax=Drosophila mojavensis TaxID=7230 RepID=B4KXK7_DROMO|nr:uncharacterized protein LOC6582516 [Drosophila mojavensis]EDW18693.2 uncharacterized protein Dmoj_GI13366 [Drosophila mojavensis]